MHVWYRLALVRLAHGDRDGYRAACEGLLDRFEQRPFWAAGACTFAPDAVANLARPVALLERAIGGSTTHTDFHHPLAALHYRAGRFEEAVRRLNEAIAGCSKPAAPFDLFFLAMAHHRLGHTDEARQGLEQAIRTMEEAIEGTGDRSEIPSPTWWVQLEWQLLRREAEALIGTSRGP